MSIRVAECNVMNGGLADHERERSGKIVGKLLSQNADVIVMPEGINEGQDTDETFLAAKARFMAEGYECVVVNNADTDGRNDRRAVVVANRIPFEAPWTIDMGTRQALGWTAFDDRSGAVIQIGAGHFDDRRKGRQRPKQAQRFGEALRLSGRPAVALVDANSFPRDAKYSRSLRLMRGPTALLPPQTPGTESKWTRPYSLLHRTAAMATGDALNELADFGFVTVDPKHTPTMVIEKFGGRLALKPDNILVTSQLQVERFSTFPMADLSDHDGSLAVIRPK